MADKKAGTQAGANDLVLRMVKQATPAAMFKAPAKPSVPKTPGTFSSMAVPTEDIAKAQKPKPKKITPWEVRQDAVRVVGKASKLTTPEDYTLLDQFLYINRETKTGEKISPTQSKVTAPAFGVTQDAVNRARMLARTTEGRAKMAAEVAQFRQARAAASASKINEQFAPKVAQKPSLMPSNMTPQESKRMSDAADADRTERTFRAATPTGRMIASLEDVGKDVNKALAPVTGTVGKAAAAINPLSIVSPGYRKLTQAMMLELPSGSLLAIPRGLVDLMATIDRDNSLPAEKRLQTALGAFANLGGSVLGAATMADDVAKVSNALRRGAKIVPAVESNAIRLAARQAEAEAAKAPKPLGRFEPKPLAGYDEGAPIDLLKSPRLQPEASPASPVQPETPGKLQAQNVQQQPRATEIVNAPNEAGSLRSTVGMGDQATGDKLLDAIGPFEWRTEVKGKGRGRVLYQVLVDSESGVELSRGGSKRNAIDGALTKIFGSGNIPQVSTPASLRKAAELGKQKMTAARIRFVDLGGKLPETPTTAPVPTPKAPKVQPAPVVAEKPAQTAVEAVPEMGGVPDARYTKFRNDLETSPGRTNPNVYVPGKAGWEVTKKEWVALQPEPYQERAALGHESAVRRALSEGKPVTAEVLADYPDLTPKVSTTPAVPEPKKTLEFPLPGKRDGVVRVVPYKTTIATMPDGTVVDNVPLDVSTRKSLERKGGAISDVVDGWRVLVTKEGVDYGDGTRFATEADAVSEAQARVKRRAEYLGISAETPSQAQPVQPPSGNIYVFARSGGKMSKPLAGPFATHTEAESASRQILKKLDTQWIDGFSYGTPKPGETLTPMFPEFSTTPPVSTAGKVAEAGKPAPADASARATARADKAFREKHGVGLGDEVTVTYPNGKVQKGVLDHTPKTGWRIKGDAVTEKTAASIKPKAPAVEAVPTPKVEAPATPEHPKPDVFAEDDIVRTQDGKLAQVMGMTNDGKVKILERDEVTGALGKELSATASSLRKSANTMDDIRELEADVRLPGGKFEDVRKQLGTPALKKLNPDIVEPTPPNPTTGMEGLADKLAQRKAKLQEKLSKAPKAIKGKQAGRTFSVETAVDQIDYFLTSAAEAAVRKGISLRKAIQELVMAEGRDADDVAEINKALPKWADELGLDDEFINGAKATGKTAQTAFDGSSAITGTRKAFTTAERKTEGLDALAGHGGKSVEQWANEGDSLRQSMSPDALDKRISDLAKADEMGLAKARQAGISPTTPEDLITIGAHKRHLLNMEDDARKAMKSADTPEAKAAAADEVERIKAKKAEVDRALNTGSGVWHQLGMALQAAWNRDYSFASLIDEATVANRGQDLADADRETIRALSEQVKEKTDLADSLKRQLLEMPASVIASPSAEEAKVYDEWLKAHGDLYGLQEELKKVRQEAARATRSIPKTEAKIAKVESDIDASKLKLEKAQARLNEALARKKDAVAETASVNAKAMSAEGRNTGVTGAGRPMTMASVMDRRNQAIAKMKRLGGASVKDGEKLAQTGGSGLGKQGGFVSIFPGKDEPYHNQMASTVRSLIRSYADEADILRMGGQDIPPLSMGEAISRAMQDAPITLTKDQILDLLGGQYKTISIEADVARREADRLISHIKNVANNRDMPGVTPWLKRPIRIAKNVLSIPGVPKTLMFSLDYSAMGVQGRKALAGWYFKEYASAVKSTKGFYREGKPAYERSMAALARRPGYKEAVKAGLELTDAEGLGHHEEQFASIALDYLRDKPVTGTILKPIKSSEYVYSGFLNDLRMGMYEKHRGDMLGDPESLKDLAGFINIVTGRGDIRSGWAKGTTQFLSNAVISPRYYASLVQDLTMVPLFRAIIKGDRKMLNVVAPYYAKKAGLYGAVAGICAGIDALRQEAKKNGKQLPREMDWRLDNNPISNLYGRVINDQLGVNIDLFGPDLQWLKPIAQAIAGTKTSRGNYIPPGEDTFSMVEPAGRLMVGKSNPAIQAFNMARTGKTYNFDLGESSQAGPLDWARLAVPLSVAGGVKAGYGAVTERRVDEFIKDVSGVVGNLFGVNIAKKLPPKAKKATQSSAAVSPYKAPRRPRGMGSVGRAFQP